MRPSSMVSASEVNEIERKDIQNQLQSRGLKRSITEVKQAQKMNQALQGMRNKGPGEGLGMVYAWNNLKWSRTIKCLESDTSVPRMSEMSAWEQISLSEQVDFNTIQVHNVPRNQTHSNIERKAINKANTDFKNGIFGYKNEFSPWEAWCLTQLNARISVLNGVQRSIFVVMNKV